MDSRRFDRKDFLFGTLVALIMITVFIFAGGRPLLMTFVPGVVISWILFFRMYRHKRKLPKDNQFYPLYFGALSWQFLHLNEEFVNEFYLRFPALFGAEVYSQELFISLNMISYFVFAVACLLVFSKGIKFLIIPVLFFLVYGTIGNAITHTWWVVEHNQYFPGFYTALAYWLIGPFVLSKLITSVRETLITVVLFALILLSLLLVFT